MSGTDALQPSATLTPLSTPRYFLGEGPAWDAAARTVSWIDIEEGLVVSAPWQDGGIGELTTLEVGGLVGAAIPIAGGRFLITLACWIGILHPNGRIEKSRALIPGGRRFNDAKIDPQGRFVFGSLHQSRNDDAQVLLRLEHDGSITTLDTDLHQSNGLGWSPDGSVFYNADTSAGLIYRRPYVDGVAGERSVFVQVDEDGRPDGLTVDTDGNLWVTVFNGGRIDCYRADGSRDVDRTIRLDDHHPASVEFVGPDLDDLLITTGYPRIDDPAAMALQSARDGEVFLTRVGARGIPATPWREIPLPR
jgi:sugar lactone lactonase YvrE